MSKSKRISELVKPSDPEHKRISSIADGVIRETLAGAEEFKSRQKEVSNIDEKIRKAKQDALIRVAFFGTDGEHWQTIRVKHIWVLKHSTWYFFADGHTERVPLELDYISHEEGIHEAFYKNNTSIRIKKL